MSNGIETWEIFQALFFTVRNLWLVGGAWALLFMLGLGLPPHYRKIYRANIVPYLALILCSAAVWVPGLRPGLAEGQMEVAGLDGTEIGFRIALGFLLSASVYFVPSIALGLLKKFLPNTVATSLEKVIKKVW